MDIAEDGRSWPVTSHGQDWQLAWFPPPDPPEGSPHGSAAVCFSGDHVVLVSGGDGRWGMPGGRPEAGETWLDVLVRAWWVAAVELRPWRPGHETTGRRLAGPGHVYGSIWIEDGFAPLYRRVMREAGLRS
ncbi:hypothetical protein [Nonomuraea typhae]|uniref:hypothetical protein n=1 Tax=Nonomuraea typhae TaxID=2603600 RepID=UPI0012FBB6CE|nr:hypothetical protein [Nonomuraea typhae]